MVSLHANCVILNALGVENFCFRRLNLVLRQFLNCAVPIFLAISGYFIGKTLGKRLKKAGFSKSYVSGFTSDDELNHEILKYWKKY